MAMTQKIHLRAPLAAFCQDLWSLLHPSYEQAEMSAPKPQISTDSVLPFWPYQTPPLWP